MKVFEIKIGSFLEQKMNNKKVYYIFDGCDGGYGKFMEVNKNGDMPGEPVSDQYRPVLFSCYASLEELNLKILSAPKFRVVDWIKSIFKGKKNG